MTALSGDEITSWSPASFDSLAPKPTFRFRTPTPRTKRDYTFALQEEGLRHWPDAVVQMEMIRALRELWAGDDDVLAANEARLRSYWEIELQARKDRAIVVDPDEADAVAELTMKLMDAWPQLRRMNADNGRFEADAPKVALSMFLAGWSNIDCPFKLVARKVPLATLDALEAAIGKVEEQAIADKVEGVFGTGFMELAMHALGLMGMSPDTEKNSPSPSATSDEAPGSTTDGPTASPPPETSARTTSRKAKTPATA